MAFFKYSEANNSHLFDSSDILNTAHHNAYISRSMALCIGDENNTMTDRQNHKTYHSTPFAYVHDNDNYNMRTH